MNFDDVKKAWEGQDKHKIKIDADVLLAQVRRNQNDFVSIVFWRDFWEASVSLVLAIVFAAGGWKVNAWPLYLLAVICTAVFVFFTCDHVVQRKRRPKQDDSVLSCVESALWDVEHQIWLLRNVAWWYLLPLGTGLVIWFSWVAWKTNFEKSATMLAAGCIVGTLVMYWGIYRGNQKAVEKELLPRKEELEKLAVEIKSA